MIFRKFQKRRQAVFFGLLLCLVLFAANLLNDMIPDEIYVIAGEEGDVSFPSVPVTVRKEEEAVPALKSMQAAQDYTLSCKFLNLIPVKEVSAHVSEQAYVMPSGKPVGIYAKTKGVLIIGTGKVTASDGLNYEPADQIVKSGDYITSVNGKKISEKEELVSLVNQSQGNPVVLGILRDGKEIEIKIDPVALDDGTYKMGIWVRDDMAGVGTMTYVTKDKKYGALGHPVSDADTGSMIRLLEGSLYNTNIVGIVKGGEGSPGELTGVIDYKEEYRLGNISENTKTGIYGDLARAQEKNQFGYVKACMKQDIRKGEACILSSLNNELREYAIEIDDIDFNSKEENKGILFHVTDERLLSETGGIVQGMSGSPIMQDGKIIGAVTHVFISNAAKGYGVFIEKMLKH